MRGAGGGIEGTGIGQELGAFEVFHSILLQRYR